MNTFKDFFKKHLALNLLALVLPITVYSLAYSLIPNTYTHWEPFHPVILFITLSIVGIIGLVFLLNIILCAKNKSKKIVTIIFFYLAFALYLIGYYFIEYFNFHKELGFLNKVMRPTFPHPEWITDALYTILAPSFVTVFVIVGVIIFTVYLIKFAKKNKQQKTDTTTA